MGSGGIGKGIACVLMISFLITAMMPMAEASYTEKHDGEEIREEISEDIYSDINRENQKNEKKSENIDDKDKEVINTELLGEKVTDSNMICESPISVPSKPLPDESETLPSSSSSSFHQPTNSPYEKLHRLPL